MNTQILQLLNDFNIKPSLQRIAVMDYLLSHRTHPSAETVYEDLHIEMPTLSKTTIYNTLKLFADKGVILTLNVDEKGQRFDGCIENHAHFYCNTCGKIYDLPAATSIYETAPIEHDVLEIQVYYKGICTQCKKQ